MPDIICIGEMLIDFMCSDTGVDLVNGINFTKKAGGAPANVAAGCARLGVKTGFIGKVGKDPFGIFLRETLQKEGVDVSGMILDSRSKTTLAFVSIQADGERDFTFIREPGADALLGIEEIDKNYLKTAKIFHFGSISMIGGDIKKTVLTCLELSKNNGAFISYDPNLRLNLWNNTDEALDGINLGMPFADLVKISEDELEFITGFSDFEKGIKEIHKKGPVIVVVTLGKDGAILSNSGEIMTLPGYKVKSIDTTGAGDGFMAGFLYRLLLLDNLKSDTFKMKDLKKAADFANRCGAAVTTKYGAIAAMPTIGELA